MEDEFYFLESALKEYKECLPSDDEEVEESECCHTETSVENGHVICKLCGETVSIANIDTEKEWRYYGVNDSKHSSDPNRCQVRKSDEKTIYKDVENMGFSERVIQIANSMYFQVTKNKIYRGQSRKAIVFGCVMNAYKEIGQPQSFESLQSIFKLERKVILKGIKHVNINMPKQASTSSKYITPVELIREMMEKLNATPQQTNEAIQIYYVIKNKSPVINKSKPQSIASGIIYYYITHTNKKCDMKTFVEKVNLSEITILKICTEIQKILSPSAE
jgi:transcription initiation factor TFIIIB Brf1 subunit/transcription initiation factor TFIIB